MADFDNMIDMLYNSQYPNGLTNKQNNEKNAEKKYIKYINYISDIYNGYINFSIIGVIFLTFPSKGLNPENKYNFYFEENKFYCINQVNLHQEYLIYQLDINTINENTLVNDIITHMESLTIIKNEHTQQFTETELIEFSNPF